MFRKILQRLSQSSERSDSTRLIHLKNSLGSIYANEYESLINGRYKSASEEIRLRAEALKFLADAAIDTIAVVGDDFKNRHLWQTKIEPSIRNSFDALGHGDYESARFFTESLDFSVVLSTISNTSPDNGVTPYEQIDNFLFQQNNYYDGDKYFGNTPYWWMTSHSQWRSISKSPDTVYKL